MTRCAAADGSGDGGGILAKTNPYFRIPFELTLGYLRDIEQEADLKLEMVQLDVALKADAAEMSDGLVTKLCCHRPLETITREVATIEILTHHDSRDLLERILHVIPTTLTYEKNEHD